MNWIEKRYKEYDITHQNITEDPQILQELADEISEKTIRLLSTGTSIKIKDRYVAELIEVLSENYKYILNLSNNAAKKWATPCNSSELMRAWWSKEYYNLKEWCS